ncbi:MAG: RNase P subunit p30 family protein [Nanoarchaeota archaeon]|nr:RNase P subunit p30 family protein [Nanoarchaeota archaeon]
MDLILFNGEGYQAEIIEKIPFKLNKDKIIIIQAKDDKLNREVLSSKYVDILLDPHINRRKDYLHHRDSGLNQVLCKLAKENNIAVGFSLSSILKSKDRAKLIGRMMQNIKLCRKYKVPMVIGSFAKNNSQTRNFKDIQSLFKILGMTGKEVISNFIEYKLDYKKRFITKGVMTA